ncbi:MAG: ABC transporter ATP-binding protein [bacterium]
MIELKNISKVYKTPEVTTQALDGLNIKISEGEFVSITGPSGCGKTSLLNILGLLDSPTKGIYRFFGEDVEKYNERKRAQIRKNNVGFIFQNFNLIDELNVYRNIEMPLLYHNLSQNERRNRIFEIIEKLGIQHLKKKFPQQLSGGEQQRTSVARAIVAKPKFILADEPTGNLDSKNADEVMSILSMLHSEGSTIIMVTHSPDFAAFAKRTIKLIDGKIIAQN